MSTFKECQYNKITNTGELISGRLVYSQLDGGNESKAVYFGLKNDTTWVGNLSTKGTSSFYLDSDTSGCTAEVKDSTYTPTTADANTAREIWLNIPKTTVSRTIIFSYNGTTVLTVIQNVHIKTQYLFCIPSISDTDIKSVAFSLVKQGLSYDEEYISRAMTGFGGTSDGDDFLVAIEMKSGDSSSIKGYQMQHASITYVSGQNFITSFPTKWIALFSQAVVSNKTISNDYEEICNNQYMIYTPSNESGGQTFKIIGQVNLISNTYMIANGN